MMTGNGAHPTRCVDSAEVHEENLLDDVLERRSLRTRLLQ